MELTPSWMARVEPRRSLQSGRSRRWRHIAIVALSPLLCSLSIAQMFLSVLLFTYLDIPQCLVVGQIIALIASVLCLALQAYFWFLTRHFCATRGLRTRSSYRQNLFMSLHLMFTSIWWISCLNGAYIFGFGKAKLGCTPGEISTGTARVTSPCQVYQVSLSTSVPAFICSFIQLVLFVRCKRPFLSLREIFRRSSPLAPSTSAVSSSIIKDLPRCLSSVDGPAEEPIQPPSPARPLPRRPRSWLLPDLEKQLIDEKDLNEALGNPRSRSQPDLLASDAAEDAKSHLPLRANSLYRPASTPCAIYKTSPLSMSRSQSCASTLVDPASRCSSMHMSRAYIQSHLSDALAIQPVPPAHLAEAPLFAPVHWSVSRMTSSSSLSRASQCVGGEGT